MEAKTVKVKRLGHFKGELPRYETAHASGMDVRAQIGEAIVLEPGQRAMVPTGLCFEIPVGLEIQVRPRSGWAARAGVSVVNTPGTIDADYRGEVKVIVINLGAESVHINDQDRIAQLVLSPVYHANLVESHELSDTARGAGGFGSTGISGN